MTVKARVNAIYAAYVTSYLIEQGISRTRYAQIVGAHPDTIATWINGERQPQPLHRIRLCRIHGVDPDRPEDLGFAPWPARTLATSNHHTGPRTEDEHMANLLRRDLLATTAAVIYGASLTGPVARMLDTVEPVPSARVGASDIAKVEETCRHLLSGGDLMGGGVFGVKALVNDYASAVALLHGRFESDSLRVRAHVAAASATKQVGWNLYDLGRHDHARRMWVTALAMSRDVDPPRAQVLQSWILTDMAQQCIALGKPQQALDLLGMASGRERHLPLRWRSFLSSVRAIATAELGDAEETSRHIAWAQDHFSDPVDDRDTVWNATGWYHGAEMNGMVGNAEGRLALHLPSAQDVAIEHMTASLETFDSAFVRSKARVQNSIVRLHAIRRDVTETESTGWDAVHAARRLRSPRVIGELLAIEPYLRPMRKHPGITALDREISDLTKA